MTNILEILGTPRKKNTFQIINRIEENLQMEIDDRKQKDNRWGLDRLEKSLERCKNLTRTTEID